MALSITVPVNDWNALKLDDLAQRWDCEPYDIVKTLVDAALDHMTVKESFDHPEMIVVPETCAVVNMVGQLERIKERNGA